MDSTIRQQSGSAYFAEHMQSGAYAALGKSRMVERNINHFLTGRWF
jgi:hypothetical protein